MGGRSPNAANLKSITGSLQPLRLAAGMAVQRAARSLGEPAPKREVQRHACHVNALSIFPLDVLLHLSPHLEEPAPNLLEERHHLVDFGIARQIELRLAGPCSR